MSDQDLRTGALPAPGGGLGRRRQVLGAVVALLGLPVVAVALAGRREDVLLSTPLLLMLAVVVASALLGGIRPALPAAVGGFLLLNVTFTEPYGTFQVHRLDQALALGVYLAVTVAVSAVVGLAARRHSQAVRAAAEAEQLSALAGTQHGQRAPLGDVLLRILEVFDLRYAAVVDGPPGSWSVIEARGEPGDPDTELHVPVSASRALRVSGRTLSGDDQRVLTSFARAAAASLEAEELAQQAQEAARLAGVDALRTALLAGVGHDLRTPLAGIKAAVTSLRADDVTWTDDERDALLDAVETSADRLEALVANLLATSRLDAGALSVELAAVDVEEIVGRSIGHLNDTDRVVVDVPDRLPLVQADIGLAERIIANLVDNALRYSDKGTNVLVTAAARGADVVMSVVDTGPGLPASRRGQLFTPYQRAGDRNAGGLGLGLSVAHGFAEAMGGSLLAAETDGGGLTMHLRLPQARQPEST